MTDEVTFGQNMTTLNFALSRTASRDWVAGDEVVATKLDHDANISPWLEIAHDKGVVVKLADLDAECRIDLDHLRSLVTERTKVVAFPMAVERSRDDHAGEGDRRDRPLRRRARLGRRRALRAARGHRDPRDRLRRAAVLAVQVLRAAPGPRLGAPRGVRGVAALQGAATGRFPRPAPRDGDARARAAVRVRRVRRVPARRGLEVHH